jgi:hypothetical protein
VHDTGRRLAGRLAATLVTALVAAACQATPPGGTPAPTPRATPATTAAATQPAPSPSPSPQATGIPALEVAGSPGELHPGRYTTRGFEPRITFELDGPWHSVNAFHGFFDVQQDVASPDVIAVQFALPDQAYAAPDQPAAVTTAQAMVTALQHNTRLLAVESSSSHIGGLTGYQITVENPADKVGNAQVLHVSPGALSISPGRRLWCAFFDTPNGVLAILVGGSVAKWDEALAAAEPVLESVTIGR